MATCLPVFSYETESWVNPEDEGYPKMVVAEGSDSGETAEVEASAQSRVPGGFVTPGGGGDTSIPMVWVITSTVGKVIPVKWDQDSPYNTYVPGGRPAGCVATACAIVMAHWGQPSSHNGFTYDWDVMVSTPYADSLSSNGQNMVARLMQQLGADDNLDMDYRYGGSTANIQHIHRTFKNFGYSGAGSFHNISDYDFNKIIEHLGYGRPAIVFGDDRTLVGSLFNWDFGGHAWVVDQVITEKYVRKNGEVFNPPADAPTRKLAHCNWGWGGSRNGYFTPDVWDSNNRVSPDISAFTRAASAVDYYYQYQKMMVVGMDWDGQIN